MSDTNEQLQTGEKKNARKWIEEVYTPWYNKVTTEGDEGENPPPPPPPPPDEED